jgi:formylglycine-generating enzyme required for sulfatase activity
VRVLKTGGWEWTATVLEQWEGFRPMQEYPEYSTDFYDGHHYVLRGSSPFTDPALCRDSFRNFFQRQYPYVFAKFRCCMS